MGNSSVRLIAQASECASACSLFPRAAARRDLGDVAWAKFRLRLNSYATAGMVVVSRRGEGGEGGECEGEKTPPLPIVGEAGILSQTPRSR